MLVVYYLSIAILKFLGWVSDGIGSIGGKGM